MKYRKLWLTLPVLLAVLWLGFRDDDLFFQLKKNFTLFGRIYEELATGYVPPTR